MSAAAIYRDAIGYVLDRAAQDPDGLGRHLCPLTESWRRLVDAEAKALGIDRGRNRIRRRGGDEAAVLAAWDAYASGERDTVLVRTNTGPHEVTPVHRARVWIVHPTVDHEEAELFAVTHGPSGRAAHQYTDRDKLVSMAERLALFAPDAVDISTLLEDDANAVRLYEVLGGGAR